eukprot:GHUV01008518.1.p1 GENE.GHUV01008518.1~~GHUV01008518.1.p1  ORF type:complete len:604 (+),score=207.23 GHUV01008518.1:289-2100(+)
MGAYIGQCDDFVQRYLAEALHGASAASQQCPAAHMVMNGATNGLPAAAAAPRNPHVAHSLQWQQQPGLKREQDTHMHEAFSSSRESAAAQQRVAAPALQRAEQQHTSSFAGQAQAAAPRYTSAFSLPSAAMPTLVGAALAASNAHPAMSMPMAYNQAQAAQPWLESSLASAHAQLCNLQQAAQQHNLATSLSAPAATNPAAAAAASLAARAHSQALSSSSMAASTAVTTDDEPDLSHLTVMQRYHARRKLAVQRMEREVEEKIAQLALLEQENRKLKWQAHILENMLLDIDKQLEVMSSSDAAPDAGQWLTLLGMGQGSGNSGRVARTVHRVLEGAGQVDVSGWTVQECRRKWLGYLDKLKPLVEAADAAQEQYRSKQPTSMQELTSCSSLIGSKRPRRAAAAAAQAVIQQEAADVLGVTPVPPNAIPEPPAPFSSSPSATALPPALLAAHQQQQTGQQQQQSPRSHSSDGGADQQHINGSDGVPAAHLTAVEGIPQPLLHQIEQTVLETFYWLLAMMVTNPVLTYEFISMDLEEGAEPLPPQEDKMWEDVVTYMQPTLDQLQECATCIQVGLICSLCSMGQSNLGPAHRLHKARVQSVIVSS